MLYTKSQMKFLYLWKGYYYQGIVRDVDSETVNLRHGYHVLSIANTFFALYFPDNTINDLYKVERLLKFVPEDVYTRKQIIYWLFKSWSLLN